jgi:type VI protein secretion system component VasK
MKQPLTYNASKNSLVFLLLSLLVAAFWVIGRTINVYQVAFVGVVFEFLWLPMIAFTFILPILSFLEWRKEKFKLKSLPLYALIIILLTMLFVLWQL